MLACPDLMASVQMGQQWLGLEDNCWLIWWPLLLCQATKTAGEFASAAEGTNG